jgi:hypothetical protein
VLDNFHAWQHLSDLSKTLPGTPEETALWTDQARTVLLESGWPGIDELLQAGAEDRSESQQTALDELRNDLANHQHHLNYAPRLATAKASAAVRRKAAAKT